MRSLSRANRMQASRQRRERATAQSLRRAPRAPLHIPTLWWVPVTIFLFSLFCAIFLVAKQSTWDTDLQQSFVIISGQEGSAQQSVTLVTLKGKEESVSVLPVPDDVMIEAIDGYGRYRASALEGLRVLEKKSSELLTQSLAFQFGIHTTDVIWIPNSPSSRENRAWIQDVGKRTAFLQAQSTLGVVDRLKLYLYISKIPKEKWSIVNLNSSDMVKKNEAGIGSELDISVFDPMASDVFADLALRQGLQTVAIVNASQEQKVATKVGRALSTMGMDVISVTSISESKEKTQLLVADTSAFKSRSTQVMKSLFELTNGQVIQDAQTTLQYRADLVLIVGKDWGVRLRGER